MKNSFIHYNSTPKDFSKLEKDFKIPSIPVQEVCHNPQQNEFVPKNYTRRDLNKAFTDLSNSINKVRHLNNSQAQYLIITKLEFIQLVAKVSELQESETSSEDNRAKEDFFLRLVNFLKLYQPLIAIFPMIAVFLASILNIFIQLHRLGYF